MTEPADKLKKAIDLVTKAVDEDKNENYSNALDLYDESVECFMQVLRHEDHSIKAKQAIRAKVALYVNRADKIGRYLTKVSSDIFKKCIINAVNFGFYGIVICWLRANAT